MKNRAAFALAFLLLVGSTFALAQIPPIFPTPLQQFPSCKTISTQWSTTSTTTAPGNNSAQYTISGGGLVASINAAPGVASAVTSIAGLKASQPSYIELTVTAVGGAPWTGIVKGGDSIGAEPGTTGNGYGFDGGNGQKFNNNVGSAYGSAYGATTVGIAFNGALWFSVAGIWQNGATLAEISANVTTHAAFTGLTSGLYYIGIGPNSSNQAFSVTANFGASAFSGTVPRGFRAGLC